MADERKVLINIHTGDNRAPSGSVLNYGEIAVNHSENAALYTKIGANAVAKFINEDEVDRRISGYTDDRYNELADIIQDLADMTITDIKATSPISASTKALLVESCGNTVTISHVTGSEQSGFTKLSTDVYGHVTAGTEVVIGDISGLTGFQKAVRDVETKLSNGSVSGTGNAVTDILVNDHEITLVKGEKFALSGHTHDASEIVSGVLDIERIPTAPVSSSASGTVATGEQIQAAIDNALTSSMNYKGATSSLPSSAKTGDFYVADAQIEIPAASSAKRVSVTAETGDYIIARDDTPTWDVVEKNLDGAVTSTGMTAEQIVLADGSNTIKSVDPATVLVGSATTAVSAITAESAVTTESAETAVSAITSISAETIDLSGVQNADGLKAIEALPGTEGLLKKVAADTWELVDVIDTVADFSGLTASGSLVDAKVVKDVIVENERITSAALNDLNDRLNGLSASTVIIEGDVIDLENRVEDLEEVVQELSSITYTQYASAITINGDVHTVANNGVDLGNYLSADTKININGVDKSVANGVYDLGTFLSGDTPHITTIQQTETASAVTTTINYMTSSGTASAATIVQDIIIDCGNY